MAYNNANEITIAANGEVSVAAVGTALPTNLSTLSASYFGLGYVSEDGVTVTVTPEVTDTNAWQSRSAIRREFTSQELQAAFALMQWNEETIPLAFGGGAITEPSSGVFKYTFPDPGAALDERTLIVDFQDGTRNGRLVIPRGNVTDSVETQFQRTNAAILPITFKALQPTDGSAIGYVLFDDATAFAAGS